jgi:hypothetical protein
MTVINLLALTVVTADEAIAVLICSKGFRALRIERF